FSGDCSNASAKIRLDSLQISGDFPVSSDGIRFPRHLSVQPCFGVTPLALYRSRRDAHYFSSFFHRKTGEEPQFDKLALLGVHRRERAEALIEDQDSLKMILID